MFHVLLLRLTLTVCCCMGDVVVILVGALQKDEDFQDAAAKSSITYAGSDAATAPNQQQKLQQASTAANTAPEMGAEPAYMKVITRIMVLLHVLVFISGLVGNALVCLSVYRNKSLQTVTNYYIVNLAVADFLVILICLPPTVYWDLTLTWNFGALMCKLVPYLQSTSVSVSVLTLTCISINRWYAIVRPLEFSSTKFRPKTTIILIWLASMIIALPDLIFMTTEPLFEEAGKVYSDCTHSWPETNTKIYQLCIVALLFVGPFVLMSISYSHIVNVLWRNETMAESVLHSVHVDGPLEEPRRQPAEYLSKMTPVCEEELAGAEIDDATMKQVTAEQNEAAKVVHLKQVAVLRGARSSRITNPTSCLREGVSSANPQVYDHHYAAHCANHNSSCRSMIPSNCRTIGGSVRRDGNSFLGGAEVAGQRRLSLELATAKVAWQDSNRTLPPILANTFITNERSRRHSSPEPAAPLGPWDSITGALVVGVGTVSTRTRPSRLRKNCLALQCAQSLDGLTLSSGGIRWLASSEGTGCGDQVTFNNKSWLLKMGPSKISSHTPQEPAILIHRSEVSPGTNHVSEEPLQNNRSNPKESCPTKRSIDSVGSEANVLLYGSCGLSAQETKSMSSSRLGLQRNENVDMTSSRPALSNIASSRKKTLSPMQERKTSAGKTLSSSMARQVAAIQLQQQARAHSIYGRQDDKTITTTTTTTTTTTNTTTPTTRQLSISQSEKRKPSCFGSLCKGDKLGSNAKEFGADKKSSKRYLKNQENYAKSRLRYNQSLLAATASSVSGGHQLSASRRRSSSNSQTTAANCGGIASFPLPAPSPDHHHHHHEQERSESCCWTERAADSVREARLTAMEEEEPTIYSENNGAATTTYNNNLGRLNNHRANGGRAGAKSRRLTSLTPIDTRASCGANNARFCKLIESRKKAAKMLIVIVIMFGLCYLPVHFLNILRNTIGLPQNDFTLIASLVSHWLCYFNSAVNPLIYNLMSEGKFRHEFARLFLCRV